MLTALILTKILGAQLNLAELPSCTYVAELARSRKRKEFEDALKFTSSFLDSYKACDLSLKRQLISKWYEQSRPNHVRFAQEYAKGTEARLFELSHSQVDLTKLDLLLLTDGMSPIFHTEGWLRLLYSTNRKFGSEFKVPTKNIEFPQVFSGYKGPPMEPARASFDPFFSPESEMVAKWINGNFANHILQPMTHKKMIAKMSNLKASLPIGAQTF